MKKEITRKELINGLVRKARSLKWLHDRWPEDFSKSFCIGRLCDMACFFYNCGILSCSDTLLFQDIINSFFN